MPLVFTNIKYKQLNCYLTIIFYYISEYKFSQKIRDRQWYLCDTVINDYSKLIMARNEDVYVFDTYFYFQLTRKGEKSGWESVKRWTKHLNIFSKRKLLIPINFSSQKYCHWLLICVHMDEKKICYYNSAKGAVDQIEYMSNIRIIVFPYPRLTPS